MDPSPMNQGCVNRASGDGNPGDGRHETFFNVLPTNHKFYGIQDLNAFQNLTDLFVQARAKPGAKWTAEAAAHFFRLSESGDAWYGGSGAASDEAFGFDARRPAAGHSGRDVGTEFDLVAAFQATDRFGLEGGLSRFEGMSAARRTFPAQPDATFAYLQVTFAFHMKKSRGSETK